MRLTSGVICFICAVSLGSIATGQPNTDPKIRGILQDWKGRFNGYKSARYALKGTIDEAGEIPIPEHLKGTVVRPAGEKVHPVSAVVLIDFTRGRLRIEETKRVASRDSSRWVSEYRVSTFDGQNYRTSLPRDRNELAATDPDLAICKGNLSSTVIESYLWPVLLAHGIVPLPNAPPRVDRLPKDHDPEELTISGSVIHEQRSCVAMKTDTTWKTTYELWVDPGRASSIVRFVRWDERSPSFRLDIRYQSMAAQPMPESWSHTSTTGGKVTVIAKLKVESVQFDVPLDDNDYTLPTNPGMLVVEYDYPPAGSGLDPQRPSRRTYRVGADGSRSLEGEEKGFMTIDGVQLPPEKQFHWMWWVGATLLLLLCVAVCWIRIVRRRRALEN